MPSSSAISAFSIPRAIRRSTSRSRDGQLVEFLAGRLLISAVAAHPSEDHLGGTRREPGHAVGGGAHGQDDPVDRGVLGEKAARAGLHDRGHVRVVGDDGQGDDADRGVLLEYLAGGLGPLEIGHAHIHQHDVRLQFVRQPYAHTAAGRLRDDFDPVLRIQQRRESGSKQIVVVDDEYADRPVVPRNFAHFSVMFCCPVDRSPTAITSRSRPYAHHQYTPRPTFIALNEP